MKVIYPTINSVMVKSECGALYLWKNRAGIFRVEVTEGGKPVVSHKWDKGDPVPQRILAYIRAALT